MVKLLLNKNGLTLIETVIVLLILSIILLTNLAIYNNTNILNFYLKEDKILETKLTSARQIALNTRSIVYIKFYENTFIVSYNDTIEKNVFKSIYFQNSKELYFNKNGNLNHAYTILFKQGLEYKKLIFYLGKGWYKIE